MPVQRSTSKVPHAVRRAVIETLEDRCLKSVSLAGNTVELIGTPGDDHFIISREAGDSNTLIVQENPDDPGIDPDAGEYRFALRGVSFRINSIYAQGDFGADLIEVDESNGRIVLSCFFAGEAGDDTLIGGSGNDVLLGDDQVNEIHGGRGTDYIDGGADDDSIFGDSGNDKLFGRGGFDSIEGGDGDDDIFGGIDDDTILGGDGNNVLNGDAGFDLVSGDTGRDIIHGGTGDDTIDGGKGGDVLYGDVGTDSLDGSTGNDQLLGGAGDDDMNGGSGNDSLDGGAGSDLLFGEAGRDRFFLQKSSSVDELQDFDRSEGDIRGSFKIFIRFRK